MDIRLEFRRKFRVRSIQDYQYIDVIRYYGIKSFMQGVKVEEEKKKRFKFKSWGILICRDKKRGEECRK